MPWYIKSSLCNTGGEKLYLWPEDTWLPLRERKLISLHSPAVGVGGVEFCIMCGRDKSKWTNMYLIFITVSKDLAGINQCILTGWRLPHHAETQFTDDTPSTESLTGEAEWSAAPSCWVPVGGDWFEKNQVRLPVQRHYPTSRQPPNCYGDYTGVLWVRCKCHFSQC